MDPQAAMIQDVLLHLNYCPYIIYIYWYLHFAGCRRVLCAPWRLPAWVEGGQDTLLLQRVGWGWYSQCPGSWGEPRVSDGDVCDLGPWTSYCTSWCVEGQVICIDSYTILPVCLCSGGVQGAGWPIWRLSAENPQEDDQGGYKFQQLVLHESCSCYGRIGLVSKLDMHVKWRCMPLTWTIGRRVRGASWVLGELIIYYYNYK